MARASAAAQSRQGSAFRWPRPSPHALSRRSAGPSGVLPVLAQVEAAQRRAPFAERKEKKRKRTEDGVSTASATDAAPGAVGSPALPADGETPGAPEKAAARRKGPGAAARAAAATTATTGGTAANGAAPLAGTGPAQQRPAKRQRKGVVSEGAREKQALVRTVALGNLSPAVRAQAVAYARSVGQVRALSPAPPGHMLHSARSTLPYQAQRW